MSPLPPGCSECPATTFATGFRARNRRIGLGNSAQPPLSPMTVLGGGSQCEEQDQLVENPNPGQTTPKHDPLAETGVLAQCLPCCCRMAGRVVRCGVSIPPRAQSNA